MKIVLALLPFTLAAAPASAQLLSLDLDDLNALLGTLQGSVNANANLIAGVAAEVSANAAAAASVAAQLGARVDLSDGAIALNAATVVDLQADAAVAAQLALDVDADLAILDQQVSGNTVRVETITRQIATIEDGLLVRQASPGGVITVGAATGGDSVDFTGTDGPRRLTGVAPGIMASDAATVGQMDAGDARTLASANSYTDARFDTARSYTDQRVAAAGAGLRKELRSGIASAAALAGLPQPMLPGTGMIGAAIGGRGDAVAFAAGLSKSFRSANAPVVKAAIAVDADRGAVSYNAGVGLHF